MPTRPIQDVLISLNSTVPGGFAGMTGNSQIIPNVKDPENPQDVGTKNYIDTRNPVLSLVSSTSIDSGSGDLLLISLDKYFSQIDFESTIQLLYNVSTGTLKIGNINSSLNALDVRFNYSLNRTNQPFISTFGNGSGDQLSIADGSSKFISQDGTLDTDLDLRPNSTLTAFLNLNATVSGANFVVMMRAYFQRGKEGLSSFNTLTTQVEYHGQIPSTPF